MGVDKSMKFFSDCFEEHRKDVMYIIRRIPPCTKVYHIVCNYAKSVKDSSLAEKVPKIMSVMEALNFHVKDLLDTNNCQGAFSIGNLVTRDITGEIVEESGESGSE